MLKMKRQEKKKVEIRGVEPRASRRPKSRMRSERSTTELHPQRMSVQWKLKYLNNSLTNATNVTR